MIKAKILVLYTGGTFGMDENLEIPALSAAALKKRLLQRVPEMGKIADCTIRVLFNMDSCQMGVNHWWRIAEEIRKSSVGFDGVVVLHGTDTLSYTAAALSMLLSPCPVPVVLTGAQKPLYSLRNDARSNLLTALETAAYGPKELRSRVLVAFHDEVFLGSRVRKHSAFDFGAFESPRFPRLARVGSGIHYEPVVRALPPLRRKKPLIETLASPSKNRIPRILKTEVLPEFPSSLFRDELLSDLDSILLTLYPSATAPTESEGFLDFLLRAQSAGTRILAITERAHAPARPDSYASGQALIENGVLWCGDLTPEAATVKATLLHLLDPDGSLFDELWEKPLSDETGSPD
jgi:L-asparaginase